MTTAERTMMKAQMAFLKSTSPTRGPTPAYRPEDIARAIARLAERTRKA